MKKMKVKELLNREIDIDVVDNVCEELYIAFCGPVKLTEEGKEQFKSILDIDVEFDGSIAVIDVESTGDQWESVLRSVKKFFQAAAGYCSVTNYDKWFRTV